jgi:heme/copper-type cytochrome/quinol oxidase subunit 4
MNATLSALPAGVLVAIGALALVQVVLDVIALVDLYRRPVERVVFDNKWIWVVLILLVSTIGPILYLVVGRKPAAVDGTVAPPSGTRPADVADSLYGPRDDDQR